MVILLLIFGKLSIDKYSFCVIHVHCTYHNLYLKDKKKKKKKPKKRRREEENTNEITHTKKKSRNEIRRKTNERIMCIRIDLYNTTLYLFYNIKFICVFIFCFSNDKYSKSIDSYLIRRL